MQIRDYPGRRATPFLDGDRINTSALTYNIILSSSDSIIEGALISVGGKHKTFLQFFSFFFVIIAIVR